MTEALVVTIMLEAMSLGRPVIASAVGGVYSVVRDGETGLVVPPQDSGAVARQILGLLDDPVRARTIVPKPRPPTSLSSPAPPVRISLPA